MISGWFPYNKTHKFYKNSHTYLPPTTYVTPTSNSGGNFYSKMCINGHVIIYRNVDALNAQEMLAAEKLKISKEEFMRRHNVVAEAAWKCDLRAGDAAWPITQNGYNDYGYCSVRGVTTTYLMYCNRGHHTEWPKNDAPFIVSAYSHKTQQEFICTFEYLTRKKPDYVVHDSETVEGETK